MYIMKDKLNSSQCQNEKSNLKHARNITKNTHSSALGLILLEKQEFEGPVQQPASCFWTANKIDGSP
jgi:hypothetical protein